MTSRRIHWLALALVASAFALPAVLYDRLPAQVPTHWDLQGRPDGYTAKPWGPFVAPLIGMGMYLLFQVLPAISPRRYRIERFRRVYDLLATALVVFAFALTILTMLAGLGVPMAMDRAMGVLIGALLVVLGNFLGKTTKNFFVGIRTPWTLASDEVWLRTHRLGGKLFVAAGLVAMAAAALAPRGWMLAAPAVLAVVASLIAVGYSYWVYRRIEGAGPGPDDVEPPGDADPGDDTGQPREHA
jgi:uncharacterized membrane protein